MEDLLFAAIDRALELGASYAEARYHRNANSSVIVRNEAVIGLGADVLDGVAIRVLVDGSLGFSSTNRLTRNSILSTVEEAVKKAKAAAAIVRRPIEFSEERLGRASYEVVPKRPFDSMAVEEKIEYLRDLYRLSGDALKDAVVASFVAFWEEGVEEKAIVNSDGAFVRSKIPRLEVYHNITLALDNQMMNRWEQHGASGGLEALDDWALQEWIPHYATVMERILAEAVQPPRERVDVVVGSEIVGLLVHESCGHPSEADRVLGREAAQAGTSFMRPDMLGERIGTDLVTVIDDPTIPGSYGFYLYDDEGVPARPRYLYRNGIINEHLHNRWTAKVYGVRSNASARANNYKGEPIVRMANTYFAPGDHSVEELIEGVKFGVYIKTYQEWNIDDMRWGQRYVGQEAYLIENGRPTKMVKNPALEITTKGFYSSVDAVGKDLSFEAGTCGKGEPGQGIPVWFGGPTVRIRNVPLGVVPQ